MNGAAANPRNEDPDTNLSPQFLAFSEEWVPVGDTYTYVVRCGKIRPNQPLILIIPGATQIYFKILMISFWSNKTSKYGNSGRNHWYFQTIIK